MGHGPPRLLRVGDDEAGLRLEQLLRRRLPALSRGAVQRLIARGLVRVEGRLASKGERMQKGQVIELDLLSDDERPLPQPELPLEVLRVTPGWVAVSKACGMPSHPLLPGEKGTLANALLARFPECGEASPAPREGGLVHRLDASTSGVLLAARSAESYGELRARFAAGGVHKRYLALVAGAVEAPGTIDCPLRARPGDPRRMQAVPDAPLGAAQEARSDFTPLQRLGALTLVEVRARTGRRHQVRVHLAHLGHPLAGDALYGGPALAGVEGAFLHAAELELAGEAEPVEAPLPEERRLVLERLGARLERL